MTVSISMNDTTYKSPDYIISQIEEGSLTREDLESATWAKETPRATLGLTYNLPAGEVEEHEIDLIELDKYYDWSSVQEHEITVKHCFLRVNGSEWELDSDELGDCTRIKRPDRIEFNTWSDRETIEYCELREYGPDWEEVDWRLVVAEEEEEEEEEERRHEEEDHE